MLMTADTFKMGTLIGLVFCTLIMGGKIIIVESAVYSSPDTAIKFSQCLIEKMRESPFFTVDDINSMFEVQDVMAQALLKKKHSSLSVKILVNAFSTALADIIIIDSDVSKNTHRKGIYSSALEQCSLSSIGYIDVGFIGEAQKILSIIEANRAPNAGEISAFSKPGMQAAGTFGSVGYSQATSGGNPFAVQPSPVQNPLASQYFHSNDKTIFVQQEKPDSPPMASSAQIPFNPQYPVNPSSQVDLASSFGTGFRPQSGGVPQASDFSGISQTRGSSSSIISSSQYENFPIVSDASGTPQSEKGFLGPHSEKNPNDYDTGRVSAHEQYPDYNSDSQLENMVMNILTTSPKFRKAFNSEISQENAINLARALTEQTFADYNLDVRNDALSVVTEEVVKVRVPSPETFAFALSKALVYVLKRHESSLSSVQSQLATIFLSSLDNSGQFYSNRKTVESQPEDYSTGITLEQSGLDNSQQFYSQQQTVENQPQDYSTGVTLEQSSLDSSGQIYSEQETVEKDYQDYNTDVTSEQLYTQKVIVEKQPQDYQAGETDYSEFNEKQSDFDFQSPPLSPEDRKDEMFSLSLSRYLSNSQAIRNFFCDHNEPQDVVQISFSIIKASLTEYGMHVASLAASVASGALSELSKEGLCNNYAKTISETVAEILEESGIKDASFENIGSKMELNLIQRQITPTESQKPPAAPDNFPPTVSETYTYESVPNTESSFITVEEIIPQHQEKTEDTSIITPSDYKDVPDYEYTHPLTLLKMLTNLFTARPTVPPVDEAPDGIIDQQASADYMTEKFDNLESYDSTEREDKYESSEETSSTTIILENQENGEEVSDESSAEELSQGLRKRKRGRKGKKKEKVTTPQPDIVTTCSDEEVYNPTTTDYEDEIVYHQDDGEILQKDVGYTDSTDVKTTSVQLQPSFQGPVLESEYSTASFQSNSGVRPSDSDHTDPSLALSRQIVEIAESSSAYIRSENFDVNNLCVQINQLAPLVNVPVLGYCKPVAAVDYLLNVLSAAVRILKGV